MNIKHLIYIICIVCTIFSIGCSRNPEKISVEPLIIKIFKAKTGDLSPEIKDSLLQSKKITFRDESEEYGEDEVWEEYLTIIIDSLNNTLKTESTESMNSSFISEEYRVIKTSNKEKLIYSKTVGSSDFTAQSEFGIYDYNSTTNELILDTLSTDFFKLSIADFFKENTPDSIFSFYENSSNCFYRITYNKKGVAEYLFSRFVGDDEKDKWLKGEVIVFYVKDDEFYKTEPQYMRDY